MCCILSVPQYNAFPVWQQLLIIRLSSEWAYRGQFQRGPLDLTLAGGGLCDGCHYHSWAVADMDTMYGCSHSVCPSCMGMVCEGTHPSTGDTCLHWGCLGPCHLNTHTETYSMNVQFYRAWVMSLCSQSHNSSHASQSSYGDFISFGWGKLAMLPS